MTATFPRPAWLVGCGNMAGAMVEGWRAGGVDLSSLTVIRPSGTPVEGVTTVRDYPSGEAPRLVILGFKPQKLDEISPGLAPHVGPDAILVSMLAGARAATLREHFPNARSIFRIMPNLPVAQIQGVTAIYPGDLEGEDAVLVRQIMSWLGMIRSCDQEETFAIIGAIASSGPAYVARFIEALAKGGEKLGLRPIMAQMLATQVLIGTGAFAAKTGHGVDEIARLVASPKGTTEQGLAVLDAPDGLQSLVDRMLAAALRRGEELAAEARRD